MDTMSSEEPEKPVVAQQPLAEPNSPVRKGLKRPRVEIDSELEEKKPDVLELRSPMAEMGSPSVASTSALPIRDERYYMEDGSCVIRVEDTLFNVHRSMLSRDSSSFSTLFTLPQGGHAPEGSSDERPIYLRGDNANQFRNFLWVLYALPMELQMLFNTQSDVSKLLDIAKVAHKYSFKSLESWACDALELWANKMSRSELESSYKEHLQNVIHVARLCHHDRLLATIVSVLQQLMHSSLAYLTLALSLADELDMDTLTGAAYYAMLLKGEQFWNEEAHLTSRQRLRLLNGYYRLTNEWERYRNTVPAYAHAQSCGVTWSQGQCRMSWDDFWKKQVVGERVMKANLADVVGRLKSVMREMDRWGPWGQSTLMHHECRQEIKKTMLAEIKLFEQRLATYFPPILD